MQGINKSLILVGVVAVAIGLFGGYVYGSYQAYDSGYEKAVADAKLAQEAAAAKAAADAAKEANPFQAVNPLEDVTANPFEKAKKVLNPFE